MSRNTEKDRMRNRCISNNLGVVPIKDKNERKTLNMVLPAWDREEA